MSLWTRIANAFRGDRLSREIDEELQSHIEEAIEQGRDPEEARRAFGPALKQRERSRDVRMIAWMDSLRADAVFGWRRLQKSKVTAGTAILSLALAIGACTSAFRLIDALLLRPLPVAHPERIYDMNRHLIGFDGQPGSYDSWSGPVFRLMRDAAGSEADLIAVSYVDDWTDLTYASDQEMEKAYVQYVSGRIFTAFGLQPSAGRLFTENDDVTPGAHPVVVISHDYWTRRFGRDPGTVGRTLQLGSNIYEIVGVGPATFTGTEPGTMIDVFVPTMMNPSILRGDSTWLRTLAVVKPGSAVEPLRQKLASVSREYERERAKGFIDMPAEKRDMFLSETISMDPAPAGVSSLQQGYRPALIALGALVGLVLLIACANVANLMTAQAAARSREMALRVSIGAGRWRLVQLVLVEGAWVALLAAAIGAWFTWQVTPFVVRMINPADRPIRLDLPADWRVLGFAIALTVAVTFLFGLAPALRASSVKPASALKGGDNPHSRRRLMHALIAAQVAFCFLVIFVAGLFVATFQHLSHEPTGFSAERILNLETVATPARETAYWEEVADHLKTVPGVEQVALAARPLLNGYQSNTFLSINGGPPSQQLAFNLNISPGWLRALKIPLIDGRDFGPADTDPGAAIVNETFAKMFFNGENPVGRSFGKTFPKPIAIQIVGLVRDAKYSSMREPDRPVFYVPVRRAQPLRAATFVVRTLSANPLAIAQALRQEVRNARPDFRVSNIRTQQELNESQMVRERLLATLGMFFGAVALLLASVGLYGVLNYSVVQRRREIGIRLAIGARSGVIARLVTFEVFAMVAIGAIAGVALGLAAVRSIATLFYNVSATDPGMLAIPALMIVAVALLSSVPAVVHAVRIDPLKTLRSE